MALAIESNAKQASYTGSGSFTISKPSGLQEGDLMIAAVASAGDSGTSITGWTSLQQQTSIFYPWTHMLYKVATSSDVAASSFTVNVGSGYKGSGIIYRISGAGETPVIKSAKAHSGTQASSYNLSLTVSPDVADALIFHHASGYENSDLFSQGITGGATVSFAEDLQVVEAQNQGIHAVARGSYASADSITAADFSFSGSVYGAGVIIVAVEPAPESSFIPKARIF